MRGSLWTAEVEPLVELSRPGRTVPHPGQCHPLLSAQPEGQCHAGHHRNQGADEGDRRKHAAPGIAGHVVKLMRVGLQVVELLGGSMLIVPHDLGGAIVGITEGTRREHIARATLEAIAFRTREVVECLESDSGLEIDSLRVDGGPTANRFLMQFQADILGIPVQVPDIPETTALGAAYLAGLAVDVWEGLDELKELERTSTNYEPGMLPEEKERLLSEWRRAVSRAQGWQQTL